MWQPIETAPYEVDLELAVIDDDGPHTLVFACQRGVGGWLNAATAVRVYVQPTHWRIWTAARAPS
jgi:hypothetical protein